MNAIIEAWMVYVLEILGPLRDNRLSKAVQTLKAGSRPRNLIIASIRSARIWCISLL